MAVIPFESNVNSDSIQTILIEEKTVVEFDISIHSD